MSIALFRVAIRSLIPSKPGSIDPHTSQQMSDLNISNMEIFVPSTQGQGKQTFMKTLAKIFPEVSHISCLLYPCLKKGTF